MAIRDPQAALIALNRFGLGAKGSVDDLARVASDPRGFVLSEAMGSSATLDAPQLKPTPELARALFDYRADVKARRDMSSATTMSSSESSNGNQTPMAGASDKPVNVVQETFRAEALARFQRAASAPCGIVERLVAFWSNHFCISANRGEPARMWAGAFEREAIRPHVLGHFADMLNAVEHHPAMLFFLDNQQSVGPSSRAAQNGKRGLNENLAREILELHTLGVGGGYTQADVTAFARVLTGWTYAGREGRLGVPGTFVFNPNAHESGAQTILGKAYTDSGVAQGDAVLADLARSPATAKFVATKLARHFSADDPPPSLVAKLQAVFLKTDGDLRAVTQVLIAADETWRAPLAKIRAPYDYLIAMARLLGNTPEVPQRVLGGLNTLGQPLWTPAGPNGFADTNAQWASPEGMKLRLDIASQIATRMGEKVDARDLIVAMAGEALSSETRQAVARAESRAQALTLAFMSPEFQRR